MEDGIDDPNVSAHVFPNPAFVRSLLPELSRGGLSIFREGHHKWLGRSAFQFAALTPGTVRGEITYTFPVVSGLEVAGWVDDSRLTGSTGWIVFADDNGRILGFGKRFAHGLPQGLPHERIPSALAWAGFAKLPNDTSSFAAYVVNKRGLISIPGPIVVPPVHPANPGEIGPVIPVKWQKDSIWTPDQLPPHPAFSRIPAGTFFASWGGSDTNTGTMTSSSFDRPANGCIVVPVWQGPASTGLSAEVIDADTRTILAEIPLQDGWQQWSFWKIKVPESTKHVQIVGRDQGRDWGEWLALASPDECR
jgi:hypothetical protein